MVDFYQHPELQLSTQSITTIHDFGDVKKEKLIEKIKAKKEDQSITLIIPAIPQELEAEALDKILTSLRQVDWIDEIVVTFGKASGDQAKEAFQYFSERIHKQQNWTFMWNESPQIKEFWEELKELGLAEEFFGKGSSIWISTGYVLAQETKGFVITHDTDITTYDNFILSRLLFPLVELKYDFSKGYYARCKEVMYGRVVRLFLWPILDALLAQSSNQGDKTELLQYLRQYRYPLAGEFSATTEVLNSMKWESGWALEIGMLRQIYKEAKICQVDLGINYDHKHQELSQTTDAEKNGLGKMVSEIFSALHNYIEINEQDRKEIQKRYIELARRAVGRYKTDAEFNGLDFDEASEQQAIDVFNEFILLNNTATKPSKTLPAWEKVFETGPSLKERLLKTVKEEHSQFSQDLNL